MPTTLNACTRFIMRLPDVINATGLSRTTIYRLIRKGDFPAQVSLGEKATGWHSDQVQNWINSRVNPSQVKSGG